MKIRKDFSIRGTNSKFFKHSEIGWRNSKYIKTTAYCNKHNHY